MKSGGRSRGAWRTRSLFFRKDAQWLLQSALSRRLVLFSQVLVQVKRYEEAVACFDLLGLDGSFKLTEDHYLAAMKAATVTKDQELIKTLVGEVLMDTDVKAKYGAIMEMAAKSSANANNWRLAAKLLEKAPAPRAYDTHHAVLASCGRNRNVKLAIQVGRGRRGKLRAVGFKSGRCCRRLTPSLPHPYRLQIFEQMKGEGHRPKRATYNALLHACSEYGETEAAKVILEEMNKEGIRLNVVTYNIGKSSAPRLCVSA